MGAMMKTISSWRSVFEQMLIDERSAVGFRPAVRGAVAGVTTLAVGIIFMVLAEQAHRSASEYVRYALTWEQGTRVRL